MQAKAAVLYEAGAPLRLEEVEVLPPQRGEVQVRMYAGGVCHSDLHVMKGDLVMPMPSSWDMRAQALWNALGKASPRSSLATT